MATRGIDSENYWLSDEEIAFYKENGFLHVKQLLTAEELEQLEKTCNEFLHNKVEGVNKDFGDITGNDKQPVDSYSGISVMLPSKYSQSLMESIFKKRAAHIAQQIEGAGLVEDYDRFISKKPNRPEARFHWHQDKNYCWSHGQLVQSDDVRAVTFSISIDPTNENNGCIWYVPGSHKDKVIREHIPVFGMYLNVLYFRF